MRIVVIYSLCADMLAKTTEHESQQPKLHRMPLVFAARLVSWRHDHGTF
jgi:hypothetical protein